jgi:hypothetical protein
MGLPLQAFLRFPFLMLSADCNPILVPCISTRKRMSVLHFSRASSERRRSRDFLKAPTDA